MGFISWLRGRLTGKETVEISAQDIDKYIDHQKMNELCTTEFFTLVAISMISNLLCSCEFRTCMKGKEVKEQEYYLWNFEPNQNQSAGDFRKKIIETLIKKNECLIVEILGKLYVSDGYSTQADNALKEKIFTNVQIENTTLPMSFSMSQVVYLKLNNQNITNLLQSINSGYERVARKAMEDYELANGRKGIMKIDTLAMGKNYGEKTFEEIYQDLLNNRFEKYFNSKNAVLPLFDGFNYEEKGGERAGKAENKAKEYIEAVDESAKKTALAFNIPPQLLLGNVEGLKDAVDNLLTICIDPLTKNMGTAINRSRYGKEVLKGCYLWIDTTSILHIDIFNVAEKIDKLIASGMCSIDELRRCASWLELGTEESQKHYITKNYQEITSLKGGET